MRRNLDGVRHWPYATKLAALALAAALAGCSDESSMTPGSGPSRQTSTSYTYYFEYDDQDTGTRRPVPGAEVKIDCLTTSYTVHSTTYPFINSDGSFTFTCPYGYFDGGSIRLVDIYSEVMGEGRAVAGVGYFNEGTARRRTSLVRTLWKRNLYGAI